RRAGPAGPDARGVRARTQLACGRGCGGRRLVRCAGPARIGPGCGMRLHRLEVRAFGPFAGTETVDFDTLADGGLHLVHGPTGAGKSSILDAICFALFASVPRHRGAKGLHSDHARPESVPQVVLEFTAGGRRLRITRSPTFSRPKRRGTGE